VKMTAVVTVRSPKTPTRAKREEDKFLRSMKPRPRF
jgi:hypothetical protein